MARLIPIRTSALADLTGFLGVMYNFTIHDIYPGKSSLAHMGANIPIEGLYRIRARNGENSC